jgi:hypothetical protein
MNQKLIILVFMFFTLNVDAGMLCDMYGQNDVLCQSEKMGDTYTEILDLDDKCDKGDDSACRKLAEIRKRQTRDDEIKASAKDLKKLRIKCYQYDNQEACSTLEELKR